MHGWVQFGAPPPDDEDNFRRGRCIQLLNSVTKQTYSTLPQHTHLVPNNYASANFDLCLQFENEQYRWLPKKDGGWHGDDRVTEIGSVIACACLFCCAHCFTMLTVLSISLPHYTPYAHCAIYFTASQDRNEKLHDKAQHRNTNNTTTSSSCLAAS